LRADTNGVGFRRCSCVAAHVNVVVPVGECYPGERAHCEVAAAAAEIVEGADAAGGIADAGGVKAERAVADGSIAGAGGIVVERLLAAGDIVAAGGVTVERVVPAGDILVPSVVAEERVETAGDIGVTRVVAVEREDAGGGIGGGGGVAEERVGTDGSCCCRPPRTVSTLIIAKTERIIQPRKRWNALSSTRWQWSVSAADSCASGDFVMPSPSEKSIHLQTRSIRLSPGQTVRCIGVCDIRVICGFFERFFDFAALRSG